jgi:hypothetical protein
LVPLIPVKSHHPPIARVPEAKRESFHAFICLNQSPKSRHGPGRGAGVLKSNVPSSRWAFRLEELAGVADHGLGVSSRSFAMNVGLTALRLLTGQSDATFMRSPPA